MAATAQELREEIASRREAIDRDLDELGDKVDPRKVVSRTAEQTVGNAKRRVHRVQERIMGTAEHVGSSVGDVTSSVGDGVGGAAGDLRRRAEGNPLGAAVAAFGLGLVVAAVWPATDAERRAAASLEERAAGPMRDSVKQLAKAEGEAVVADLREPAQQAVQAVEAKASDAADSVSAAATS